MDSGPLSSPERHQSAISKDRKKRKRAVSAASSQSDSESSVEEKQDGSPMRSEDGQLSNKSSNGKLKAAAHDAKESTKRKAKKARHVRKSSVTSLKHVDKEGREPPSTKKRQSSGHVRSRSKAKSIGDDEDDNVSIADSTVSTGRVRRNEAERIQYFENQPECGKIEPHQVQCLRCDKSVNLGRRQTYTVRPWEIHRASCDQRPARKILTMSEAKATSKDAVQTESPSAQWPMSQTTPARRPSEQDRREFLESDHQVEMVEKHRVSCRKCQTWVDLGHASSYATGNWVKHKVRCSAVMPSSRVAAAKQRLLLVNDPQAASFDSRNVGCALCGLNIVLEGGGDFNLTKWNEHKSICVKPVPISKNDSTNSIPFPGHPPPPPLSSASTEDTVVVDAGLPGARHSLKRPREDTDNIPVDDMPKVVRPRTQSYLPPTMDPPNSVLGWFMLPFHSFVRGFKESIKEQP